MRERIIPLDMSDSSPLDASTAFDDAIDTIPRYIFGHLKHTDEALPTLVVASPTADGWSVRSTDRSYNHDYVCFESWDEVMEWLDLDLTRPFLCRDREEVMHVLLQGDASTGYLLPGEGGCTRSEEVNRVLQHLESGWGAAVALRTPA